MEIKSHYDQKKESGSENRLKSEIIQLRTFNNFIKSVLITQFTNRNDHILDLCCGKGGDLLKFSKQKIKLLIGLDVSDVSITQATSRYSTMKHKTFKAIFQACDCFSPELKPTLSKLGLYFNSISCQFALHYGISHIKIAFGSKDSVELLFKTLSDFCSDGAYFYGTIPNSNWIIKKLRSLPKQVLEFGNDIYTIRLVAI
jgi:mRNA (guanine-N7-)-methyltransferase